MALAVDIDGDLSYDYDCDDTNTVDSIYREWGEDFDGDGYAAGRYLGLIRRLCSGGIRLHF